jgi:hypothetical protein
VIHNDTPSTKYHKSGFLSFTQGILRFWIWGPFETVVKRQGSLSWYQIMDTKGLSLRPKWSGMVSYRTQPKSINRKIQLRYSIRQIDRQQSFRHDVMQYVRYVRNFRGTPSRRQQPWAGTLQGGIRSPPTVKARSSRIHVELNVHRPWQTGKLATPAVEML